MRIGILGAGQLGRMLAHAGMKLGHSFVFYDEAIGEATKDIGTTVVGSFTDRERLAHFASQCDVVTYEFENIPCDTASYLASLVPVYPPPRALEVSQDRVIEKEFIRSLGLKTPAFQAALDSSSLQKACDTIGYPCIVKTTRLGYDGKGQARVTNASMVVKTWKELGEKPLIVEAFVPFSRELSVIGTRAVDGNIATYPLAHNIHVQGILHRTEIPAPNLTPALTKSAHTIVAAILNELQYVGTLTVELFDVEGELLVNEIAPRVHNSGHATIDSIQTSQFENHIRAITGAPLGSVNPLERGVMYNIVGTLPAMDVIKELPRTTIHLYNKSERAGRKIGHITLLNPSAQNEETVEKSLATR